VALRARVSQLKERVKALSLYHFKVIGLVFDAEANLVSSHGREKAAGTSATSTKLA